MRWIEVMRHALKETLKDLKKEDLRTYACLKR